MSEKISKGKEITVSTLKINVQPAVIVGNWEKAEADIKKKIEDKKCLITPETIQGGKNDAAELRKEEKKLAEDWKAVNELVNGDFNKAASMVMKFRKMFTAGADEITAQVNRIEQETKDICRIKLTEFIAVSWDEKSVLDEFRVSTIEDLVKLGSLTAKGELTKAVKTEIENRCVIDKSKQDKFDARIKDIELRCLKVNIEVLTRASIEAFLFKDDDEFNRRLDFMIEAEVKRNEAAAQKIRDQVQAEHEENNRKAVAAALEAQESAKKPALFSNTEAGESTKSVPAAPVTAAPVKVESEVPTKSPEVSVRYSVTVTYKVKKVYEFDSKPGIDHEKIRNKLRARAIADGISEEMIVGIEVKS